MKVTAATWKAIGGLALLLVLAFVVSRTGGSDGSDGSTPSSARADTPSSVRTTAAPSRPASDTDDTVDPDSGLPWIGAADLPAEAREVLRLIDAGGPFAYDGKDGSTFGNFEGVLPARQRGYYLEYTVETPGSRDRGARRIVTGGDRDEPSELYWTDDHYESFSRIRR